MEFVLSSDELKTLVDIGLGAVSLMLWFRQGKVNKAQQEIDAKQNQTSADLTMMVRDHETRITKIESGELQPVQVLQVARQAKRKRR
jgi:hypothetical protein